MDIRLWEDVWWVYVHHSPYRKATVAEVFRHVLWRNYLDDDDKDGADICERPSEDGVCGDKIVDGRCRRCFELVDPRSLQMFMEADAIE